MPSLSYISPKAIVRDSPIHGKGLFAIELIAKGEIVCVKGGYIFRRETLRGMPDWYQAAEVPIADGLFIGPLNEGEREGSMIFSNHSCEPNIGPLFSLRDHHHRRDQLPPARDILRRWRR